MSDVVTPISKNAGHKVARIRLGGLADELRADLAKPEVLNAQHYTDHKRMLEELDALSSEHLVKLLELAHRRAKSARDFAAEEQELKAELEHAAYFAFMAGVPQEAIAEIDDRTADALSRAILRVEAQA